MSDLNDKVTLLELAAYWMQMAEEAERKTPYKNAARHI
jgi:hypothetical protein